ncbi:unnamed protein product [Triticum turgidum subsp. durum]|uniref:Uncharacterized protein n=2 Tax=Triticum TaxID=4564 RepID=A0A9R0PVQ1_TRITD|nr:unnamed protein product [Triticum turgidum subsp. durum]
MGFIQSTFSLLVGAAGGIYIAQNYDVPNIKNYMQGLMGKAKELDHAYKKPEDGSKSKAYVFPFTPRYIIPVAGMMVGNAMTVTGVTMKKLHEDVKTQRSLVETALALGATPRQATVQQVRRSLVIALSPVIDNAKTVGLIALPGAMTGLIMGGASPLEAIQLQIVVMNMLMGASTVSSILSTYLCWPAFFTKAFQIDNSVFAD